MACMQPNQAQFMQMKVIETVRNLSGTANNFVSESNILNALSGFNLAGIDNLRMVLGSLVQANKLECFVPMTQLGSCSCAGGCCDGGCGGGCCDGGCCGSGRYYRIKIG